MQLFWVRKYLNISILNDHTSDIYEIIYGTNYAGCVCSIVIYEYIFTLYTAYVYYEFDIEEMMW